MKTLKKRLVLVVMSLVLFITGNFSIGGMDSKKANALSPNYSGESYTIYYLTDYYPTLTYNDLTSEFPGYNVVYDRQFIGSTQFDTMVYGGYFSGFDYGTCVVVIDIKLFKPNPNTLFALFYDWQHNQGCVTAFVSSYSESAYSDITFLNYVNVFVDDGDFTVLREFLYNAFYNLQDSRNGTVDSTTYLIDTNLVNIYGFPHADMDTLCSGSPFLRIFLEELISSLETNVYSTYEQIAAQLRNEYAIKILVYDAVNDYFVDILTWIVYSYDEAYLPIREESSDKFVCAFGFWSLTDEFYQVLYNIQYEEEYDLPVYLLIVDPVNYGPMGLNAITNEDLQELYGCQWVDEAYYILLDGLREWIEE